MLCLFGYLIITVFKIINIQCYVQGDCVTSDFTSLDLFSLSMCSDLNAKREIHSIFNKVFLKYGFFFEVLMYKVLNVVFYIHSEIV